MILARRTPGEPLAALALVLMGWVGLRAVAWELALDANVQDVAASPAPAPQPHHVSPKSASRRAPVGTALVHVGNGGVTDPADMPRVAPARSFVPTPLLAPLQPVPAPSVAPLRDPATLGPQPVPAAPQPLAIGQSPAVGQPLPANRIAVAGGHQMLWIAATALLPFPPLGLRSAPAAQSAAPPAAVTTSRWSGDGWLLLRRGNGTIAPGPSVGSYGASQAGAVLRYRLISGDPHRLNAYVRGTGALNGSREQQVALGLAARPLARIPVTAMAELRGQRDGSGQHLRPALALVTELPPQKLPLGFTGEVYVQGGYVGGRYATAFIDGLARAERPVTNLGKFRLRAGAGAWGAKQRGAARLDVGPTASVTFRLADTASARLAADWRFRVGGDAKPDSGPALTLSAGF